MSQAFAGAPVTPCSRARTHPVRERGRASLPPSSTRGHQAPGGPRGPDRRRSTRDRGEQCRARDAPRRDRDRRRRRADRPGSRVPEARQAGDGEGARQDRCQGPRPEGPGQADPRQGHEGREDGEDRRAGRPRGARHPRRAAARAAADARGQAGRRRRVRPVRRRHHARGAARPLPRHGPHPALRRGGHLAPAPGRAGPVGLAARPGGGADRLGPGDPRGRLGLPDLPGARCGLVPGRRPGQPARHVPRRQPRRLGPEQQPLPALHDRHRLPDAARHRVRHGHHQGRRGLRRHRLLR